jgi:hypothetical protein
MTTLDPKLAQILGIPANADPHTTVAALLQKGLGPITKAYNRAVARSGLRSITIEDADPEHAGKQRATVDPRIHSGDTWMQAGARIGAFVTHSPVAVELFIDEAKNVMLGLPQGRPARALDSPLQDTTSDTTVAILAPGIHATAGNGPRGIFGIDDAIVLGVGVPLLCALIPFVIPFLITVGGTVFSIISSAVTGKPADAGGGAAPQQPPDAANPIDAFADKVGIGTPGKNDTPLVLGVIAALVVGYIVMRRMARKG